MPLQLVIKLMNEAVPASDRHESAIGPHLSPAVAGGWWLVAGGWWLVAGGSILTDGGQGDFSPDALG